MADGTKPLPAGILPAPIQGALFMIGAAFCFCLMNVMIREASQHLHILQVLFFRNFFAATAILPLVLRAGLGTSLRTGHFKLHLSRALVGITAMYLWFYAVTLLPLAEATALNFTVPLFATAGAALVLGETVRLRRWSATIIGFVGVLIIIRPGFQELTPAMALPVAAALFMAMAALMVKRLSDTETPLTMVLYMNLFMVPISFVPALFVWSWPPLITWLEVIAVGALGAYAQILIAKGFQRADASMVMPFDYSRLPFIALLAYLVYGEVPDLWTWVGAGVIAASAIYIARREAQVARERATLRPGGRSPSGR